MKIKAPKKNKSDLLKKFLKLETDLTPKINEAIFNKFFEIWKEHFKTYHNRIEKFQKKSKYMNYIWLRSKK